MNEDFSDFVMMVVVPLLTMAFLFACLLLGYRMWNHNVDVAGCQVFATEAGRDTRFVDYTFWTWDCLTPVRDGTWISIDNLRGQEES